VTLACVEFCGTFACLEYVSNVSRPPDVFIPTTGLRTGIYQEVKPTMSDGETMLLVVMTTSLKVTEMSVGELAIMTA
jgi:hypothetical protein